MRQLSAIHYYSTTLTKSSLTSSCVLNPPGACGEGQQVNVKNLQPASDICEKQFPHIQHVEGLQVGDKRGEAQAMFHQRPVVLDVLVGNLKMGKVLGEAIHLLLVKHHVVQKVRSKVSSFSHLMAYP